MKESHPKEGLTPDEVTIKVDIPSSTFHEFQQLAIFTSQTDAPLDLRQLLQDMARSHAWILRQQLKGDTIASLPSCGMDILRNSPMDGIIKTVKPYCNPDQVENAKQFFGFTESTSPQSESSGD